MSAVVKTAAEVQVGDVLLLQGERFGQVETARVLGITDTGHGFLVLATYGGGSLRVRPTHRLDVRTYQENQR